MASCALDEKLAKNTSFKQEFVILIGYLHLIISHLNHAKNE
jgi:hypothetical protein